MDLELGQESKSAGRGASLFSADGYDKSRVRQLAACLYLAQGLHGFHLKFCKAVYNFDVMSAAQVCIVSVASFANRACVPVGIYSASAQPCDFVIQIRADAKRPPDKTRGERLKGVALAGALGAGLSRGPARKKNKKALDRAFKLKQNYN